MRYLMTFSYDGSKYSGYQKQPNLLTIQEVLESKLTQINSNKTVNITASGRTDALVHALSQKAHFDLDVNYDCNKLKNSLNKMLPASIYVKDIEIVEDDFHARFQTKKKTYVYKINVGEYNPIEAEYIYQYNKYLDIDKMKEAITNFIGEHNFKSYTKGCEEKESFVRTIYDAKIEEKDNIIYIRFTGNGFLRYMVRNMVGSLIEVGNGKINSSSIIDTISKENRIYAGFCAPACGLYLENVEYVSKKAKKC